MRLAVTTPSDLARAQHNQALQRGAKERRHRTLEMLDEHPDLRHALVAAECSLHRTVMLAVSPRFHEIRQTVCESRIPIDKYYPHVFPEMPGSAKVP